MRSRSFGTLMSSVTEDTSARLVDSPLGNTSAARSRLFCKHTECPIVYPHGVSPKTETAELRWPLTYKSKFYIFFFFFFFTFLMKLLLFWTRLKAGPIAWMELVSLETKGGAWTCSTSASSRGGSFNLFCWWSCDTVWECLGNLEVSTHMNCQRNLKPISVSY